jgi:hypothetical protein
MKINKIKKLLMLLLFQSSKGLLINTLCQRLLTSQKELDSAIQTLEKIKFILIENERIILSKKGYDYMITNDENMNKNKEQSIKVPEDFIGPSIEINAFYIPQIKKIKK